MRKILPLKQRPVDYIYPLFFFVNLFFITYIVDLEQLVIKDPDNFNYPVWPSIIVMSILFTNVTIICSEEIWGPTPALNLPLVLLANAPWFFFPIFLVWKMWKNPYPFTKAN
ncbi:MAG: hypothetical protein HQ542_02475 [Bacteroidia bacterium]|nr:hypothetical protein [Bacteroidia bacterium]